MKRFLKVTDCTQQLQVRENVVRFEKALGAVKVIKDQIQYRSQSLLNLARDYFSSLGLLISKAHNGTYVAIANDSSSLIPKPDMKFALSKSSCTDLNKWPVISVRWSNKGKI